MELRGDRMGREPNFQRGWLSSLGWGGLDGVAALPGEGGRPGPQQHWEQRPTPKARAGDPRASFEMPQVEVGPGSCTLWLKNRCFLAKGPRTRPLLTWTQKLHKPVGEQEAGVFDLQGQLRGWGGGRGRPRLQFLLWCVMKPPARTGLRTKLQGRLRWTPLPRHLGDS